MYTLFDFIKLVYKKIHLIWCIDFFFYAALSTKEQADIMNLQSQIHLLSGVGNGGQNNAISGDAIICNFIF